MESKTPSINTLLLPIEWQDRASWRNDQDYTKQDTSRGSWSWRGGERGDSEGDNIFGVGTVIDAEVIEKAREGETRRPELVEEIDKKPTEKKQAYSAPLLQSVLWAYRCTPHIVTGSFPAMLALGMQLQMPVDLANLRQQVPMTDNEHKELVAAWLRQLCDCIPGLCEVKEPKSVDKQPAKFELGQRV